MNRQFPWLEYDVGKDATFCYCYSKFPSKTKGFHQHEESELHKSSYTRWIDLKKIQDAKAPNIFDRICPEREEITSENREYLIYLIRVHDETDESQNGKWISFIGLQLDPNPLFRKFHEKFSRKRSILVKPT
ncbi:unnamed protein product [Lepeophtheirus salmonis]|uniref:(salmon louse) hypothetical protein n=1 Tax=Lepeophtheirus salmonis TaxID=72036 RepID=A0A817FHU5_LEPSM|nr:unnamed protein product [Lepeophtheirus salmonis]CAG9478695.1 unnamed protein product [Lepeophtheirus salmonis]